MAGDGTVGVHNAGLDVNGTYTEIFGYVEPTDVPGALLLHLDGGECGKALGISFTALHPSRLLNIHLNSWL